MFWDSWFKKEPTPVDVKQTELQSKWKMTISEAMEKYGSALAVVEEFEKDMNDGYKPMIDPIDFLLVKAVADLSKKYKSQEKSDIFHHPV